MPSKRDPSKQRRQARNRAEREARAARRDAAHAPPPQRPAVEPAEDAPTADADAGAVTENPRAGRAGRAAAARGAAGAGRPTRRRMTDGPPGTRAAFLAFLFTIGALATVAFLQIPVDADGNALSQREISDQDRYEELVEAQQAGEPLDEAEQAELAELAPEWEVRETSERNAFAALWPLSISYILPVGLGYLAVRLARSPNPARGWLRSLIALVVFSIVSGIPILYLPAVAALGVAVFQNRKAQTIAAAGAGAVPGGTAAATEGGGVIDVTGSAADSDDDDGR